MDTRLTVTGVTLRGNGIIVIRLLCYYKYVCVSMIVLVSTNEYILLFTNSFIRRTLEVINMLIFFSFSM